MKYRVLAVKGADPQTRKFVDMVVASNEAAQRVREICAKQGYSAAVLVQDESVRLVEVRA